jgi:DNA (cytosine-5)-methyltransferase 1
MAFYFGNSKAIHSLTLDGSLARLLAERMPNSMRLLADPLQEEITRFIASADIANMQAVWTHKGPGGTRAFMVLDKIDEIGGRLAQALATQHEMAAVLVAEAIDHGHGPHAKDLPGLAKLSRNAPLILAGLLIGSVVNPLLDSHIPRQGVGGTKEAAVHRRG